MTRTLDLRERPEREQRGTLFDALDDAGPGAELDVVAPTDVDPHLVRYQLERGQGLSWAYADPDAEPRELLVAVGDPLDDDTLATIDVRDLKPQRRHEVLLRTFDDLAAGEGFVLVNDHDPKPLYHELHSMHGHVVGWEYVSRGDGECRVEVRKTDDSTGADGDVLTRYDVREIPKAERHPTIHHRYGMLPAGATMELVAPHEPRPLLREFRQRYGDAFTWDVVDSEPGRCTVHVTKGETVDAAAADDSAHETAAAGDGAQEVAGHGDGHDEAGTCAHGEEAAGDASDAATAAGSGLAASPAADEAIEVVEELDVRDRPPAERHELIFAAYDDLDAGTGFVLVNDHDPKPLYHQFDAEAGPEFRWAYRARDPGEFRVLVGKADVEATDEPGDAADAPF